MSSSIRIQPPGKDVVRISQWVGTAVHALCSGEAMPEFPNQKYVRFDRHTPTMASAINTVHLMHAKLHDAATRHGIAFVQREHKTCSMRLSDWPQNIYMSGTIDIKGLKQPDYKNVIADIKTGDLLFAAWLQLGAYAALEDAENAKDTDLVAIIHLRRKDVLTPGFDAKMVFNDAPACKKEAVRAADRVAKLMSFQIEPTASPGIKCSSCTLDCAVRAHNYKP